MKFVVLTCDKYLENRVESMRKSFLSNEDRVFLTDSKSQVEDVVGYDTPKNYDGIQDKYIEFFKNYDFSNSDHYFFIDDDTFVVLENLKNLNLPNPNEKHCILRICYLGQFGQDYFGQYTGYPMQKIKGDDSALPVYHPSGGSGFILTREACNSIKEYLKSKEYAKIPTSGHGDLTIGFWMRAAGVNLIPNNQLWWNKPEVLINNDANTWPFNPQSEREAVTFHYVDSEMMFEYNSKYNGVTYEI